MASARTQSEKMITNEQIGQINDRLTTKLRESGLSVEGTQLVLKAPGGTVFDEMIAVFRRHVEMMSNLFIRRWKIADRSQTSQAVLAATGHELYTTDSVVEGMPRGAGEEGETVFFKLDLAERGGWISDEDLDKEFALRNLEPEFPGNLAEINRADPAFADVHPNATHWKDANGKWCYAVFLRWDDERRVGVRRGRGWRGYWWFAGRRKST